MNIRLLLTVFALLTSMVIQAQTGKQATARIFESQSKELSRIVLVYETGESEIIPLQHWKLFGSASSTNQILIENQVVINNLLNDMAQRGYEITHLTNTGDAYLYTFIVFTRRE